MATAEASRPCSALFRLGEPSSGAGEWERWGWALLIAALLHAGALVVGLSIPRASQPVRASQTEAELVFLTFQAPRAAAPRAVTAHPVVPDRVMRKARIHPQRPILAPPVPAPVPAVAPTPKEAQRDTLPEAQAPEEEVSEVDSGAANAEAVTGVIAGLMDSAMTTSAGTGLGVSNGAALELNQVARAPAVLEQVLPRYPRQARTRHIEGLVLVRVIIGTDGHVEPEHTRIIRSVPALDAAAISAVSQWRFSPAIGHHGRPVRVVIDVPVQFSLK